MVNPYRDFNHIIHHQLKKLTNALFISPGVPHTYMAYELFRELMIFSKVGKRIETNSTLSFCLCVKQRGHIYLRRLHGVSLSLTSFSQNSVQFSPPT